MYSINNQTFSDVDAFALEVVAMYLIKQADGLPMQAQAHAILEQLTIDDLWTFIDSNDDIFIPEEYLSPTAVQPQDSALKRAIDKFATTYGATSPAPLSEDYVHCARTLVNAGYSSPSLSQPRYYKATGETATIEFDKHLDKYVILYYPSPSISASINEYKPQTTFDKRVKQLELDYLSNCEALTEHYKQIRELRADYGSRNNALNELKSHVTKVHAEYMWSNSVVFNTVIALGAFEVVHFILWLIS